MANGPQFIKRILEPKIKPKEITFEMPPDTAYQKEFIEGLGFLPFVWYNAFQIENQNISFFKLYTIENLPTLEISFKDVYGTMKNQGTPLDDSILTVYINPRTKNLKPIHMDFKIVSFSELSGLYKITGVVDVSPLYIKGYKSYSKKTSFGLFKDVCNELGLGFNSNIDDTDDKMTWINTGDRLITFLNTVLQNVYKSDETFLYAYMDFMYAFNYVDIEKELKRDIKEELGVSNTGIQELTKVKDSEATSRLMLTNDANFIETNIYFEKYEIINNSTSISLKKGYLTKLKYYDELSKNFLVFNVDSLMSDLSTSIPLKGKVKDENFWKQNINLVYEGKFDIDNVHKNFKYAPIQNQINYAEMDKIKMILTMKTPNYNLYRFQKIFVYLSNQVNSMSSPLVNPRLTGEWLISDISYVSVGSSYRQKIEVTRRDLQLSKEESGN